ncbi:aconitate hydratase [Lysinibacillus fusiformis]|uniref:aconitate hydratase n=1 Tax=Lysinibacillus fusiformis TaxID=28031 RepID=UPI003019B361
MINPKQRAQMHKFFILEMAMQSLQRDYSTIENLKMSKVYLPMIEKLIKSIQTEYYNEKRLLAKQQIKIVKWEIVDEYFFDLTITTPGEDQVFRYANMAVKTQIEKLLKARLDLD